MKRLVHPLTAVLVITALTSVPLYAYAGREPLSTGEGEAWRWAMVPPFQALTTTSWSFHPPGYFVALGLWLRLIDENEFLLRLPSLLMFSGSIPVAYLLGKFVHSARSGVLTALLWATAPYLLSNAAHARHYMTLYLACALTFMTMAYLLRERDNLGYVTRGIAADFRSVELRRDLAWLGLWAGLTAALFAHFVSVLLPVITFGVFTVAIWFTPGNRRALLTSVLIVHAAAALAWLLHPYGLYSYYLSPTSPGLEVNTMDKLYGLAQVHGGQYAPWLLAAPATGAAYGLWRWYQRREWVWLAFVLISWLLVPTVGLLSEYVVGSVFRPRIFLWAVLPFYAAAAAGIAELWSSGRGLKWAAIGLVALAVAMQGYGFAINYHTGAPPWDRITATLIEHRQDDDLLMVCPAWIADGIQPYIYWSGGPLSTTADRSWQKYAPGAEIQSDIDKSPDHRVWLISYAFRCPEATRIAEEELKPEGRIIHESVLEFGATWPPDDVRQFVKDPLGIAAGIEDRSSLSLWGIEPNGGGSR